MVALLLGGTGPRPATGAAGRRRRREVGAWLHIGEDGAVTVYTGKVEIGQNIRTSLTQVVAEELRTPVERIRLVMADTALMPYDIGTFGSSTTPQMASQLRRVAAAAREVLLDLAAEQGKVDALRLTVKDGKVVGPDGKPSFDFGELTKGKKLMQGRSATTPPTTPADKWTVAGTSVAEGGRPGLRHRRAPVRLGREAARECSFGKVLRPPSFKATLASVKTADAEALPGVTVVHDGDFVGVAAPTRASGRGCAGRSPGRVEDDAAAVREGPVQVPEGPRRRRGRRRIRRRRRRRAARSRTG